MKENTIFDKKSLRTLTKANPDWDELAKDCVSFANSFGGRLIFGIEDTGSLPPEGQVIPEDLPSILQKQIQNRTINVSVTPQILKADNRSEYIELLVKRNESSIASTTNGRYYIRIDDSCKPVLPDELSRLIADKGAFIWETQMYLKIRKNDFDNTKFNDFINDIKSSERVSPFVKNKAPIEILEHYFFVSGDYLTNLGILWIGKREHRAKLLYAPIIQFIKYDENDRKIHKLIYDDYSKNPKEILYTILNEIPDWEEGIEIEDGIFRKKIYNYEEPVIRELVVNALVHRPYTTRGDIFINLFPDRMEIRNPGLFPLGVTAQNILHKSVQRNPHLSKVFWDMQLMEKEGSGTIKCMKYYFRMGNLCLNLTKIMIV
jgi:ATP-dependent DNA helicase RecG